MRLHAFFQVVLHFLLSAVDVPVVLSYPAVRISSTPEDVINSGDVYGPISVGSMLYRTCDYEGYFNPDHWEESGAAEAYLKWSILVNKTSEAWLERKSEPNFFLHGVLSWSDLDCGISYHGCKGMPTCDEILTRTQNETTARQIYFILLSMNNLNLISGIVSDQSVPAQISVASMVANMANTFFWKHDDAVEHRCKLQMNAMKALLTTLITALFLAAPFIGPEILAAEAAIEAEGAASTVLQTALKTASEAGVAAEEAVVKEAAAVEEAVVASEAESVAAGSLRTFESEHPSLSSGSVHGEDGAGVSLEPEASIAQEQSMLENELTVAKTESTGALEQQEQHVRFANDAETKAINDRTEATKVMATIKPNRAAKIKHAANKFFKSKYFQASYPFSSIPMGIAGSDAETKYCALFPNVPKEAQPAHERQLDTNIREASVNFRAVVQSKVALINSGIGLGENGTFLPFGNTALSDELFSGRYVKLDPIDHVQFVEDPSRIEAEITTHFKNALISAMLKEELCFLHCTRKDSGAVAESQLTTSQFEPVPGTLCQAQCWRNWKKGKNVELYGLHDLLKSSNQWNVDLQDFVSASFKHWQDHRFDQTDENLFPTVDEILTMQATTSSGSFLPVCYSELMPPVDMLDRKVVHELPCVCGNDSGNETELFFKEAGFDHWVANHGQDGRGVAAKCQSEMGNGKLPPVTGYLELCDNGWHYPLLEEQDNQLHQGADDQCDKVRELQAALLEEGHDSHNINCRICFDTPVGSLIKASQASSITGKDHLSSSASFWSACEQYDVDPQTSCLY